MLNDYAAKICRFTDLSIAHKGMQSKHTERELVTPARFTDAYWRWVAVTFAQQHRPELLPKLDLSHGDAALDRLLNQARVLRLCAPRLGARTPTLVRDAGPRPQVPVAAGPRVQARRRRW